MSAAANKGGSGRRSRQRTTRDSWWAMRCVMRGRCGRCGRCRGCGRIKSGGRWAVDIPDSGSSLAWCEVEVAEDGWSVCRRTEVLGGRLRQGAGAGTIGRTGDGPRPSVIALGAYQGVAHVTTSRQAVARLCHLRVACCALVTGSQAATEQATSSQQPEASNCSKPANMIYLFLFILKANYLEACVRSWQ